MPCALYLPHKNRHCKFPPAPGSTFCYNHLESRNSAEADKPLVVRRRIPCPLDPNHSIYEDQVNKHVKKCSKVLQIALIEQQPCFFKGCNLPKDPKPESSVNDDEVRLEDWIPVVERAFQRALEIASMSECDIYGDIGPSSPLPTWVRHIAEKASDNPDNKHAVQCARLLEIMDQEHMLQSDGIMVEYGCGKGGLTRWLSVANDTRGADWDFALVEREGRRNKAERKQDLPKDRCLRLRLDLADFDLHRLLKTTRHESFKGAPEPLQRWCDDRRGKEWHNVVVHAKHLCGGATDLALRGVFSQCSASSSSSPRSVERARPRVCIATCCHHGCDAWTYVNMPFLRRVFSTGHHSDNAASVDIENTDNAASASIESLVRILTRMSGYASVPDHAADVRESPAVSNAPRTSTRRFRAGKYAKRILDIGRVIALREAGYPNARLVAYVRDTVTPENIVIVA